jgi:hypothetical protein
MALDRVNIGKLKVASIDHRDRSTADDFAVAVWRDAQRFVKSRQEQQREESQP